MRFIKFTNPEGGFQAVNTDRITSVIYRRLDGGRSRLSMDLAEKDDAVVLFDGEADRVWKIVEELAEEQ